jgi:hypothetical protein
LLESENLLLDSSSKSPIDDKLDVFFDVSNLDSDILSTFLELNLSTGERKVESEVRDGRASNFDCFDRRGLFFLTLQERKTTA